MSIKIKDGYGHRVHTYGYGNGSRDTKYSDRLTDLLSNPPRKKNVNSGFLDLTSDPGFGFLELVPNKMLDVLSGVKKGSDNVWTKIKKRLGFKNDHADKNYRR